MLRRERHRRLMWIVAERQAACVLVGPRHADVGVGELKHATTTAAAHVIRLRRRTVHMVRISCHVMRTWWNVMRTLRYMMRTLYHVMRALWHVMRTLRHVVRTLWHVM